MEPLVYPTCPWHEAHLGRAYLWLPEMPSLQDPKRYPTTYLRGDMGGGFGEELERKRGLRAVQAEVENHSFESSYQ